MIRAARRPLFLSLTGLALAASLTSCRHDKPAPVEELFTTRTLAMSHLQRGQLPEAEVQFKKLIELAPDDPLGYANLGLTYLQEGRFPDAERELLHARKLDASNADVALTLAKLYALTNRPSDAQQVLDALRRSDPRNPHALYALAELDAQRTDRADSAVADRRQKRLQELLILSPANLAVRLDLIDLLVRRGQADSAVRQLEEVRRIPPAPPKEARPDLDLAIQLLRAGNLAEARAPLDRLLKAMRLTSPYQASLAVVKWVEGPIVGTPALTYAPTELISTRGLHRTAPTDSVRFVDATDESGLLDQPSAAGAARPATAPRPVAIAVGDVRGDGRDNLFVSSWSAERRASVAHLFAIQRGFATDITARSGVNLPGGAAFATFADVDNDGWLDLFAIGGDGRGHLLRNKGDGTFEDVTAKAAISDTKGARKALFVDLDHDGDLDLLLIGGNQRAVYRNDLDGHFTEATAAFGLSGGGAYDAAFGDFDGDGRIDLVMTGAANGEGGARIFHNGGAQRFSDVTAASGLASPTGSGAVAVGDYDNDGHLDIFVASTNGGEPALWRNKGDGTFTRDTKAAEALRALRGIAGLSAEFVDYDNDGWLDLVVVGKPLGPARRGIFLFHNEGNGRFTDRSSILPPSLTAGTALAVTDVDQDGDEDLLIADTTGAVHLLRNDGGNSRMAVRVQLKGLRTGSGKNNDFGVGARLELRAGELYQTRIATGRVTHFGLGPHLKADVLRVEWPNGVPQTVYFPGTDQDVVELETLKGSCAFAYTWDGTRFRFVTDVMWRSALGMPLGLMAGAKSTAFAPAGASQEYLRIPGEALHPKDGRYLVQLTEELWETAYADEVKLLAVDHPDSVEVFVDERFVPPGPVTMRLYQVAHKHLPRSATDERGADLLPALRESDDVYVSNLTPTRFQGVVEPHDLVMDLGDDAGRPGSYLFLRGWIYPTDASINVALSQQSALKVSPPSLEVRDAHGRWSTAVASLGFPSGKNKTMVIALAGNFPTRDHHVRIRTNMQIYWDQAFVAGDAEKSPVKVTTLAPVHADLHARGYSRTYRKGGRYGPYWFAYDDVSTTSPWRPIDGAFTRFGDVLPLLDRPDDMYVIMAPGDETTLQFDASSASAIPKGWTRDFLLYTDGWIKDSDLNTAFGTTVGPLPFHRITSYPYAPGDSYPTDAEHQRYLREYNTRTARRARLATENTGSPR
jgi:Flp pilus assembly protein TadD